MSLALVQRVCACYVRRLVSDDMTLLQACARGSPHCRRWSWDSQYRIAGSAYETWCFSITRCVGAQETHDDEFDQMMDKQLAEDAWLERYSMVDQPVFNVQFLIEPSKLEVQEFCVEFNRLQECRRPLDP